MGARSHDDREQRNSRVCEIVRGDGDTDDLSIELPDLLCPAIVSHTLPKIRDDAGDIASPCCPRPAGAKELHKYPRTLPPRPSDNSEIDVLLDEDGIPILDEQTSTTILDDLK